MINIFKNHRAYSILSRDEKLSFSKVLVLVLFMSVLESVGIVSVMPFLAVVSDPALVTNNKYLSNAFDLSFFYHNGNLDKFLILLGLSCFFILLISSFFRAYTQYKLNFFIELTRDSLSQRLFKGYLKRRYEDFLVEHSSNIKKNILSEVDLIVQHITRPFVQMIAYSVVVVVLVSVIVFINPLLSIFMGAVFFSLYITFYLISRKILTKIGGHRLIANEERFSIISEAISNIKNVKLDKTASIFQKRFSKPSANYATSQAKAVTINQVPQYIVEAIAIGGILLVTVYLIISLGGVNSDAFGNVMPLIGLYAFAAYRLQPALRTVYQGIASFRFGSNSLDLILGLLNESEINTDIINVKSHEHDKSSPEFDVISLKDLSFKYIGSENFIFNKLNLSIKRGDRVAIIGSSGSGKTTLVDLLLGLLEAEHGGIYLDNEKITENNIHSYQNLFGYVPQKVQLLDTSIKENITFGIKIKENHSKQLSMSIKGASLNNFINELRLGYDSPVGENGCNLSGGQVQRLGLARALYKGAKVVILDEPTSALDPKSENDVVNAINNLSKSSTVICVTHNYDLAKNFKRIIMLENGRIIYDGKSENTNLETNSN